MRSDCSADLSGASAWFSILSLGISPAWHVPTPSDNRHRWWPLCGECLPGKNLRARRGRPKYFLGSCLFFTVWEFCWWPGPTSEAVPTVETERAAFALFDVRRCRRRGEPRLYRMGGAAPG